MQLSNTQTLEFHKKLARGERKEKDVYANKPQQLEFDVRFIQNRLKGFKAAEVLDLGSGTGEIINKIISHLSVVTCVEIFPEFSSSIINSPKVTVKNSDIKSYVSKNEYDLVTCFGIMHYFNAKEALQIYNNAFRVLRSQGELIVKNQFGTPDERTVNGWSDNLKAHYFANYRTLKKEVSLLEAAGFDQIEIRDIYPRELNPWDNTHYYALVAKN